MNDQELKRRFYPEANISGLSHVDGTVAFFTQIAAVLRPTDHVLDFGAGRGAPLFDDPIGWRRQLSNIKDRCQRLDGCDIDKAILENSFLDHAEVIRIGEPLPYEDNRFDMSPDPCRACRHTTIHRGRTTTGDQTGGLIAAVTPNKWGYIAVGARLVPNKIHVRAWKLFSPAARQKISSPPAT